MEVENSVLGMNAGNADDFDSEENFNFYHKNKENTENNINNSAKDLTDLFDLVSKDIPDLSEDEINKGIEKILEKTHPSEVKTEQTKTGKSKKVTFKVLFIAALLSILSFSCLFVIGNSHNVSIENGFVTFAKDTIKIVFFNEKEEEFISVDALLSDLEEHGYKDILFPQEFVTKSDEYKVGVPEYSDSDFVQVSFNICDEDACFMFVIYQYDKNQQELVYTNANDIETLLVNDIQIHMVNFSNEEISAELIHDSFRYYIRSNGVPYSEMKRIVETIG